MTKTWAEKAGKEAEMIPFTLAPDWYIEAKENNTSEEKLFEMVKDFCREALSDEAKAQGKSNFGEPDDDLVKLMIETYEA